MNTKTFSTRAGSALIATLLLAAGNQAMAADDGKAYPGSMCQAAASQQDQTYGSYTSGSLISNRTRSTRTVVCPFVRDVISGTWKNVTVRLRDRHDSQDVSCQARAYDVFGQTVFVSPTRTSVGEGFQTLTFGAGLAQSSWGPFVLSCTLPPMQGNAPTYISSYQIRE